MSTPNIISSFSNAVKSPATYVLLVFCSMFWFFIKVNNVQTVKNDENCIIEKNQLRQELRDERQINKELVNSILIKTGVVKDLSERIDTAKLDTNENK